MPALGPGIPGQERHVRRRGEETLLDHGSRLGLWLVYCVLETSSGTLGFDCDDGTDVSVSLPVAESEARPSPRDRSDDSL